jgi:lipopolysaccharide transport system ATP-binding protein
MALAFRRVWSAPLEDIDVSAPDGVVIGVIGRRGSGKRRLLELAAGNIDPERGEVTASKPARLLGPDCELDFSPCRLLLLDHTFAQRDLLERRQAALALDRLSRSGATTLLVSQEEDLLRQLADEIWWLKDGKLAGRGDPAEILTAYRRDIAEQMRTWGESAAGAPAPRIRRGDGRAEVLRIDLIGENGAPTAVLRSGELTVAKVVVRFKAAVEDPVVGILIRTRIGLNVYGTNTELERLKLGPRAAGDTIEITYAFRCDLCPAEYTLTAASHDPDGVWHDWLEDAVAFAVTDHRYTAGVANLRAQVSFK